jgi:hypothetical protein
VRALISFLNTFEFVFLVRDHVSYSYCNVFALLETPFGLVIGFIKNILVVTTISYYTIARLHNLQSLHSNLLSLSALVLTS